MFIKLYKQNTFENNYSDNFTNYLGLNNEMIMLTIQYSLNFIKTTLYTICIMLSSYYLTFIL